MDTNSDRLRDLPGLSARRPAAKPGATKTVNALATVKIDFAPQHRQPSAARVLAASVVAIAGSLIADAVLVAIGTTVFASTKGYTHFRFSDYSKLTIVGVVIACAAWPIVTRISSAPRWLFLRMAIAVTAVLLLPDFAILVKGQPAKAVFVLVLMHLAIGIVTYLSLVCVSPVDRSSRPAKS